MTNFTILTYSFLLTFLFVSKIYFCSDTWSTLTEVLGNYTFRAKTPGLSQAAIKPSEQLISPSSLKHYSRATAEAEEDARPVAMSVIMSTCSRYLGLRIEMLTIDYAMNIDYTMMKDPNQSLTPLGYDQVSIKPTKIILLLT